MTEERGIDFETVFTLCPSSNVHIGSNPEIRSLHRSPHLRQENQGGSLRPSSHTQS